MFDNGSFLDKNKCRNKNRNSAGNSGIKGNTRNSGTFIDSLADKLSYNASLTYNSILSDLEKVHLRKPVKATIDYVVGSLKEAKDVTKSVLLGSIVGAAVNGSIVYFAKEHYNGDVAGMSQFLKDVSFYAETIVYSAVATGKLFYQNHKKGVPFKENVYQIMQFGVTGATLSFSPYTYRHWKGEISGFISDETGIGLEYTSPITQLVLMFPFAFGVAMLRRPINYVMDKTRKGLGKGRKYYEKTTDMMDETSEATDGIKKDS